MTRLRFIQHPETGKLIPADQYRRPTGPRSHLGAPRVITDVMDPVQSMLDGKMYDSKARLRRTYREAGVTEVGNDVKLERAPVKRPKRGDARAALERAASKVGLGA